MRADKKVSNTNKCCPPTKAKNHLYQGLRSKFFFHKLKISEKAGPNWLYFSWMLYKYIGVTLSVYR